MMRRCLFRCIFMLAFSPVILLHSQETARGNTAAIFPLTLVFEAAKQAEEGSDAGFGVGLWQPDWPLELPPDAFRAESGELSKCTIEWEGFPLRLSLDTEGRPEEFPLMTNGSMAQAVVAYRGLSEVKEITLNFTSGGEVFKLEFPESFSLGNYSESFPFYARASRGNAWYSINFSGSVNEILETWYDEEGNALGAFGFIFADTGNEKRIRKYWNYSDPDSVREFYYDSRGLVTELVGPEGVFRVGYFREDLPRYWESGTQRAGNPSVQPNGMAVSLQWDEGDFLVRLLGNAGQFVDNRYEYTLDEMGNWTERKETKMVWNFDLLLPLPGTTFKRVLEYRK